MCQEITVQTGVKSPSDCKCYKAVMRTYSDLISAGTPYIVAFEAAKIVYGYHHPEDRKLDQALTVERWINQGSLH